MGPTLERLALGKASLCYFLDSGDDFALPRRDGDDMWFVLLELRARFLGGDDPDPDANQRKRVALRELVLSRANRSDVRSASKPERDLIRGLPRVINQRAPSALLVRGPFAIELLGMRGNKNAANQLAAAIGRRSASKPNPQPRRPKEKTTRISTHKAMRRSVRPKLHQRSAMKAVTTDQPSVEQLPRDPIRSADTSVSAVFPVSTDTVDTMVTRRSVRLCGLPSEVLSLPASTRRKRAAETSPMRSGAKRQRMATIGHNYPMDVKQLSTLAPCISNPPEPTSTHDSPSLLEIYKPPIAACADPGTSAAPPPVRHGIDQKIKSEASPALTSSATRGSRRAERVRPLPFTEPATARCLRSAKRDLADAAPRAKTNVAEVPLREIIALLSAGPKPCKATWLLARSKRATATLLTADPTFPTI